jgi:hypothetical protein
MNHRGTENTETKNFFIAGDPADGGAAMKNRSAASRINCFLFAEGDGMFPEIGISRFQENIGSLCPLCLCGEKSL